MHEQSARAIQRRLVNAGLTPMRSTHSPPRSSCVSRDVRVYPCSPRVHARCDICHRKPHNGPSHRAARPYSRRARRCICIDLLLFRHLSFLPLSLLHSASNETDAPILPGFKCRYGSTQKPFRLSSPFPLSSCKPRISGN